MLDGMRRGPLPARLSLNHEGAQQSPLPCASPRDALAADFTRQDLRDLPRANTPAVLPSQQMNLRTRRRTAPLMSLGEADEFAGFETTAHHHRVQLPPSDRRRPRRNTDEDCDTDCDTDEDWTRTVLARTNGLEPGLSSAGGFSGTGGPLSATAGPSRPVAPWEDASVLVSSRPQPKRTRRGCKVGPLEEAAIGGAELPFPSWRGGVGGGGGSSLSVPSLCECPVVSRSGSNSSSAIATGGGSGSSASSLAASPRVHPIPRRWPSLGGAGGLLDPPSEPVVAPTATDA